jgi:CcdB protein
MAQFDLYRAPEVFGNIAYFLDIQSDLLRVTETRVLVPLMQKSIAPPAIGRLNPELVIRNKTYVAQFQDIQSHAVTDFGRATDNVATRRYDFVTAFDLLISGI